jgi:L-iditol 2-dehydrogenase
MKAAVVQSPGVVEWIDIPDPDIPAGWVKIAVKVVGICSSDVGRALNGTAYHYPIILGHEISGTVVEVGEDVDQELVGKSVAVTPLIPCKECEWCSRGRYSLCDDYDYLGSRRDGACAEFTIAPAENLVILPDSVSMEAGALLEPASVSLHALMGKVNVGDDVVVLGAGSLGLFVVQLAFLLGAARVFIIDPLVYRAEVAKAFGAIPIPITAEDSGEKALRDWTSGRRADLVVDSCGVAGVQANSLSMVRKGGKIAFIGLPHADVKITPTNFNWLVRSEVELFGCWNSFSAPYPGAAWYGNLMYMQKGLLETEPIITHRFPMYQSYDAYQLIKKQREPFIKVMLINE